MKILLFGKNGLLGKEIFELLSEREPYQCYGFNHEKADITDSKKISQLIKDVKPNFVINATGYTNVDDAEENRELALKINGMAVGELAKYCAEGKIPLIHFSTDYIFDGTKTAYDEAATPHPINAYGESKKLGEELLVKNTPSYYLIRSQWLYGKHGKNFVDTILHLAKTQPLLKIVNDQFGKPTFAKDIALGILQFLTLRPFASPMPYGMYHMVNEGITSWFDFAKEILRLAGITKEIIPITSQELGRKSKRPALSALVNTKLPLLRPWKAALNEYMNSLFHNHQVLAASPARRGEREGFQRAGSSRGPQSLRKPEPIK